MCETRKPFVIGVAGGPASGKSEMCDQIIKQLTNTTGKNLHITTDIFYKSLEGEDLKKATHNEYNFDHPNAIDTELFVKCMTDIKSGLPTLIPSYDFQSYQSTLVVNPDVVLISGILVLYIPEIRHLFDLKVYTDVDSDTRLSKLVIRDTKTRYSKPLDLVLENYLKYAKPSFEEFISPVPKFNKTKKFADVVIPRGDSNTVAIELLARHIQDTLADNK